MKLKLKEPMPKRFGFFLLAVLFFWLKTYVSYQVEFSLGVEGFYQQLLLFINPLASSVFLFGLSLLVSDTKRGYRTLLVLYFLMSLLLFSNILYYREFTDFITIKTVLSAATTTKSIGSSAFKMMNWYDFVYWIDLIALFFVYRKQRKEIQTESPLKKRIAFTALLTAVGLFVGNLTLAEIDRPQLLTRTFDRNYIVKYLGLNVYTVYDGIQTAQSNAVRASADSSDMAPVLDYMADHYAKPNKEYFGSMAGRNVVYIHLESMQQFLIDLSLQQENGQTSEVTPFLNSLYHSADSFSFSNFFHQTSQGKTSDAELLIDNSLFGLPQGSAFTQLGATNTFHAGPQILKDKGYSSAVFHGNVGSFWDRDNVYKSFGYDYFFSSETSYTLTEDNSLEYGLKDKLFFQESVQYLEKLPQPFYTKFITVSNHFPFPDDEMNTVFDIPDTDDDTINGFFNTVHYADQALEEFFAYMKESGLYDNTVFVLYGDHYGVANSRNRTMAPILGENPSMWNEYDDAMMQRVPFIIHAPGMGKGFVSDSYGGQVDVLPTVLHLLGVDTENHIQMGQDLLAEDRDDLVVMRNGNVISPSYTVLGNSVYHSLTGSSIFVDEENQSKTAKDVQTLREAGEKQLQMSDQVLNGDLLRFYSPPNFTAADKAMHNYMNSPQKLEDDYQKLGNEGTSLLRKNNGVSTVPLYKTDAPEFEANQENEIPESSSESELAE